MRAKVLFGRFLIAWGMVFHYERTIREIVAQVDKQRAVESADER